MVLCSQTVEINSKNPADLLFSSSGGFPHKTWDFSFIFINNFILVTLFAEFCFSSMLTHTSSSIKVDIPTQSAYG